MTDTFMTDNNTVCWPIQLARMLAILAVITAATNTDVLTVLFEVFSENTRFSCPQCFVVIYNILFITTPFFALVGLLVAKPWGFIGLCIFPLVALLFEIPAIPFLNLILPRGHVAWFSVVTLINLIMVFLTWVLFIKYRKITGNKSLFT